MGVVVLSSNYLVQFPINYFGLNEILTYGAFSYPIAFLITDLANRSYGKLLARQIVYLGFLIGIIFTLLFSTDFAKSVENNNVNIIPIKKPKYTICLANNFPYDLFAKSVIKKAIG